MADQISTSLPRLADALVDVGTRLGEIGAELHALARPEADTDRDMAPGVGGGPVQAPLQPPADGAETSGRSATAPAGSTGPAGLAGSADPAGWAADRPGPAGPAGQSGPAGHSTPGAFGGHGPAGTGQQAAFSTPPPWTPQPSSGYPTWPSDEQRSAQNPPLGTWRPPPGPSLWERLSRDGAGSRILAWAGGVVTLAGVVLLLILAIQRGYLGPLPRVLLGAALGVVLTGIGAWLHRTPTARTGAYALAATGVAVLYLAVVAATSLYGFLLPWGGLLTGLAVTAGGVALAGWWDSQLFAVFVVVCCAVSSPIITGGFDALLLAFLLVLLLGTTPVQLVRRWSGVMVAAGVPPVVVCVITIASAISGAERFGSDATTIAVLAGATSGVVIVLAAATALRRPDDVFTVLMLCLAPVPGLLAAILLPRVGASILPAAVGVLSLCVWAFPRLPRTFSLVAGGIAVLAFLQATATALDGDARAIAFLAEALVLTVLAVWSRLAVALVPAALFALVGLVLGLVFAARPELLLQPAVSRVNVGTAVSLGITGALVAGVAITLCWAAFRLDVLPGGEHAPRGWVPAGLLALYGSTATVLSVGLLVSPDRDGFLLGHVLVTVSWTVAALVLLLRGIDSVALRVAGLSLVVAALAKLVLFDLSSLDGMARVMAFLVAGLVLLAAGARYAKLVAARTRA